MKRFAMILWGVAGWIVTPFAAVAQERADTLECAPVRFEQASVVSDMKWQDTAVHGQNVGPDSLTHDTVRVAPAGVSLPPLRPGGTVAYFPYYDFGGWGLWDLHEGFNACMGMSVSASFGRNRFPGVGFGTGVSAMYVHSLTSRFVLAAGGFYDRLTWNAFNQNRFGINLLAGYKLTDKVSLYAYGSKAFFPKRGKRWLIPPLPWLDNFSHRFGGMVHFKLSDAVSFSVSVEETSWSR